MTDRVIVERSALYVSETGLCVLWLEGLTHRVLSVGTLCEEPKTGQVLRLIGKSLVEGDPAWGNYFRAVICEDDDFSESIAAVVLPMDARRGLVAARAGDEPVVNPFTMGLGHIQALDLARHLSDRPRQHFFWLCESSDDPIAKNILLRVGVERMGCTPEEAMEVVTAMEEEGALVFTEEGGRGVTQSEAKIAKSLVELYPKEELVPLLSETQFNHLLAKGYVSSLVDENAIRDVIMTTGWVGLDLPAFIDRTPWIESLEAALAQQREPVEVIDTAVRAPIDPPKHPRAIFIFDSHSPIDPWIPFLRGLELVVCAPRYEVVADREETLEALRWGDWPHDNEFFHFLIAEFQHEVHDVIRQQINLNIDSLPLGVVVDNRTGTRVIEMMSIFDADKITVYDVGDALADHDIILVDVDEDFRDSAYGPMHLYQMSLHAKNRFMLLSRKERVEHIFKHGPREQDHSVYTQELLRKKRASG